MFERLDAIEKKYNELNQELLKPETLSDINKTRDLSKEISSLEETVSCYQEYKKVVTDMEEAKELASRLTLFNVSLFSFALRIPYLQHQVKARCRTVHLSIMFTIAVSRSCSYSYGCM